MSRFSFRHHPASLAVSLLLLTPLLVLPSTPPAPTVSLSTAIVPASTSAQVLPFNLAPLANVTLAAADPMLFTPQTVDGAPDRTRISGGTGDHVAIFSATGLRFDDATGAGLRLRAVGSGGLLHPVPAALPVTLGNRVAYDRGNVTEWYERGPLGIEQGFTLIAPPLGRDAGNSVVLLVDVGDGLTATQDGEMVRLIGSNGQGWEYGSVSAVDAVGKQLPAHRKVVDGTIRIIIEDAGAVYPVVVDPFIQTARLTGTGTVGSKPNFGFAVALSADGNTALIGAPYDNLNVTTNSGIGAAFVFVRTGTTWSQQGGKLVATGEIGQGIFGCSVALSGDGNTALIGASADNAAVGAAFVFTRTGATWTQQGSKLVGTGEVGLGTFGAAVALSADGNTALIGAPGDNNLGAAFVFTRGGTTWSQQGSKLVGSGLECVNSGCAFGQAVALSADGNTALIGAPANRTNGLGNAGAVFAFVRSGPTWAQQGSRFTGVGNADFMNDFGNAVALSADGNTALIGAVLNSAITGGAFIFVRSGGVWTQQGGMLTGSGQVDFASFGISVALSADGNMALIGASHAGSLGAAYTFARSGTTWTQQERVTGTGMGSCDPAYSSCDFGNAVALSADGATALIGAPQDTNSVGAAYLFTRTLITITVAPVSGTPSLKVGQSVHLQATGMFSGGGSQPLSGGTWQSSDPTIATVDANGNVTGQRTGTVTITYTQDGVVGQLTVTITAPTPIGISLPPAPASRPSGTTSENGSPSPAPAPRPASSGVSPAASGPTPNPAPPQR